MLPLDAGAPLEVTLARAPQRATPALPAICNFSKGRASRTVAGSGRLPILLMPCYPHATVPYVPLSDPEVIHRVLSEKKQLFELLLRRYNQRLYRAVIAVLGDPEAAEEAMQSAW